MAVIRRRRGKNGKISYQVIIRLKGSRPVVKTYKNKTKAKNAAIKMEADKRDGRDLYSSEAKKHTLKELIDRYLRDILPSKKSGISQKAQLLWWREQIGEKLLSNITPALIGEYRDKLASGLTIRNKKRTPATIVRYLSVLSHAFSVAIREWGWMEDSPMRKVIKPKESRGRVRFLSHEERKALLETCKNSSNPYLYVVVVLALSTGMRQGEIMNLKWSNVDFKKGRIILEETKNGERRAVPITGLALELLKKLDQERHISSLFLFPSKDYRKPVDLRFAWEIALRDSGIKDFRFHDLRHSAASALAENGATLIEIAAVLGHKTLSMVKRYAHISETHTAGIVSKMTKEMFG